MAETLLSINNHIECRPFYSTLKNLKMNDIIDMKTANTFVSTAWKQYEEVCNAAINLIKDKVNFEFTITYKPGIGPVIENSGCMAPLSRCIDYITSWHKLDVIGFHLMCI